MEFSSVAGVFTVLENVSSNINVPKKDNIVNKQTWKDFSGVIY